MARIATLHDNVDKTRYFKLERENILGRSPECNMVFEDKRISRRHARVCKVPHADSFWIEDISARGVYVNFQRIKGRFPLTDGDRICFLAFRNVDPFEIESMSPDDLRGCCEDPRNKSIAYTADLTFGYIELEDKKEDDEHVQKGILSRLLGIFGKS